MQERIVLGKEILSDLYLNKMLSVRDTAEYLNINVNIVRKYIKIYGIPARNKSWKSGVSKNGKEVSCGVCGKILYRKKYLMDKFLIFFCSMKTAILITIKILF